MVDAPVYAGRYFKTFDLAPGADVPVRLNVGADAAKQLEAEPEHIEQHRALVKQSLELFGSQHYDHYDSLPSLSKQMSGNALEHQRSREHGLGTGHFHEWDSKHGRNHLHRTQFTLSRHARYRSTYGPWPPPKTLPTP